MMQLRVDRGFGFRGPQTASQLRHLAAEFISTQKGVHFQFCRRGHIIPKNSRCSNNSATKIRNPHEVSTPMPPTPFLHVDSGN